MKLVVKKKIFALTDTYNVFDENENLKYQIVADIVSAGVKYRLFDTNKKEIAIIESKVATLLPEYIITINGVEVDHIKCLVSLAVPKYEFINKGYIVTADVTHFNYEVKDKNEKVIATLKKEQFKLSSTYNINVNVEDSVLEIILFVIAISEDD